MTPSKHSNATRPDPTKVRAARCTIHAAAVEWRGADAIRLATLIRLGLPADVVDNGAARVDVESGEEAWGTRGTRSVVSREGEARAASLAAWRLIGALCGQPLQAPHEIRKHVAASGPGDEE